VHLRGQAIAALHDRALEGTAVLIVRAKAAGVLRADFELQDVGLLLMACAGVLERTAGTAPGSWERVAAFMLDGFCATSAAPAPAAPGQDALRAAVADRLGGSLTGAR
jgi:hypothetical protein